MNVPKYYSKVSSKKGRLRTEEKEHIKQKKTNKTVHATANSRCNNGHNKKCRQRPALCPCPLSHFLWRNLLTILLSFSNSQRPLHLHGCENSKGETDSGFRLSVLPRTRDDDWIQETQGPNSPRRSGMITNSLKDRRTIWSEVDERTSIDQLTSHQR